MAFTWEQFHKCSWTQSVRCVRELQFWNKMKHEYIFSLVATGLFWKYHKYNPCFCILSTEFIHKHQVTEVLYQNGNRSSVKISGNPKLQLHGKIFVELIWINAYANPSMQTKCYYPTKCPSTWRKPGGKQWQHLRPNQWFHSGPPEIVRSASGSYYSVSSADEIFVIDHLPHG